MTPQDEEKLDEFIRKNWEKLEGETKEMLLLTGFQR